MKRSSYLPVCIAGVLFLSGCTLPTYKEAEAVPGTWGTESEEMTENEVKGPKENGPGEFTESATSDSEEGGEPSGTGKEAEEGGEPSRAENEAEDDTETVIFVDVTGEEHRFEINPAVGKHAYDLGAFVHDKDRISYEGDENYTYRLGPDICRYQGTVDWEKVRADGFEFAFIKLGSRGYGAEGRIRLDDEFFKNMENAQAAGMDVGVYFFSQAVNEEEALEEAEFVLQSLDGYELQLPVVYDPERIDWDEARTDNVTGEQFTKNAEAFCKKVEEGGFLPMIYCNLLWQAFELDMERLAQYPIWYADYEPLPQTPYRFAFWQYTNAAAVDGITGPVDLNIQLIPRSVE